jgi:hypothetical protein
MVPHLEAHSDRYITDFAILTGRRMWGQYAALSAEAAQLLDRVLGNLKFHMYEYAVSLQVEHKQFIGNGHLIGSPLR